MKIKQAEIGEAISLAISLVLIVSLFVYLITCMITTKDNPFVHVTAGHEKVETLPDGKYVLPVTIKNEGDKTISFVQLSVTLGNEDPRDIEIDYLPRGSTRKVYLYADRDYPKESIQLSPVYYKLD